MANDIREKVKKSRERSFLAKDFDGFRAQLLDYARVYFSDNIQDFSESSVGGLLLDMAAYVGDTMSFYLDHQYRELDPVRAVERKNIIRHMRNAGLEIPGPSAATAKCTFTINVDTELTITGEHVPKLSQLVTLREGTTVNTSGGITFNLTRPLDFAHRDQLGNLTATVQVLTTGPAGNPTKFKLSKDEYCVSGKELTEEFVIGSTHVAFRELTLGNADITDIISVSDANGNTYYEVESLSQDTVFVPVTNIASDKDKVGNNLEVRPAPRRFVKFRSAETGFTTLRFGSGNAATLDNDIVPDPSKISLPLYGKSSMKRFSLDPSSILNTKTLGISPLSTTISIRYRYGGGLNHNVGARAITELDTIVATFPDIATEVEKISVRSSLDVVNNTRAAGGDSEPTLDEMRASISSANQFQGRIVSKQDVLARIYTLPTEFGRVFRAGISENPINPLSSRLFILCRDITGKLDIAPDTLKNNIANYLNEFRLVSEAIDILDGKVLNYGIRFQVVPKPGVNKEQVVQTIINDLSEMYKISNMQIDQPLVLDDMRFAILQNPGVVTLNNLEIFPRAGTIADRLYGSESFDKTSIVKNGLVVGSLGSIFEIKFPEFDILGSTT
jgi:hypothetical protein